MSRSLPLFRNKYLADPQRMRNTQVSSNIYAINRVLRALQDGLNPQSIGAQLSHDLTTEDWSVPQVELQQFVKYLCAQSATEAGTAKINSGLDLLGYFKSRNEVAARSVREFTKLLKASIEVPSFLHNPCSFVDSLLYPSVVLLGNGRKHSSGTVWKTASQERFWPQKTNLLPFPIAGLDDRATLTEHNENFTNALVKAWPYAATVYPAAHLTKILRGARDQTLPIATVLVDPWLLYADIMFRVGSATRSEWDDATARIRQQFRDRGLPVPKFRANWRPRVPGASPQLIFLRPSPDYLALKKPSSRALQLDQFAARLAQG